MGRQFVSIIRLLIGTAFMVSGVALSAVPEPVSTTVSGFIMREWYVEDGLPHNVVNVVDRDSRGFLWVGTPGGLARFDGRCFVEMPMPAVYRDGGYNIRALAPEGPDSLVMITGGNRVVRLRNGVWEFHPADAHTGGVSLRDLGVDAHGALWLGSDAPSVMRWDGKRMEVFDASSGIARRSGRFCFVTDSNGRVWVAGGDFLGWHDENGLHKFEGEAGHSLMIAAAKTGGLWVASREHLARLQNGRLNVVLSRKDWPIPQLGVQDIFEAADGALWVATRREGTFRFMDGKLSVVPLRHDRSLTISDDVDGNIWLGMNGGGLMRVKQSHHLMLNAASGMPTDVSTSICEDANNALWCANQSGGLVRVKDGVVNVAATQARERVPYVSNVCADKQGRIWAGALGGLYWTTIGGVDGKGERWVMQRSELPLTNIQALFCAQNGDLWLGWDYGHLGMLRNDRFREYTKDDGFPGGRLAGVAERQHPAGSEIWIGLEQGRLLLLDRSADKIVEKTIPADVQFSRLHALFVDSGNRLWLGTSDGLLLWDEKAPRLFTSADGLPDNIINQITEDKYGRLWLSSRRGIFNVAIDQLLLAAKVRADGDHRSPLITTLLGRDENLDGLSGMVGGQPMAWTGHDGRVWFITYRGVVGFEPADPMVKPRKLYAYIDSLTVDGGHKAVNNGTVKVGPRAEQVEVAFSALSFSIPERTRVRRMLEGFDVDWVEVDHERAGVYPRLPPGQYVFRVQATGRSGGEPEAEASLTIVVLPAWWQTWWATLAALVAFAALVAWCARVISNRMLRRRLRLLQHENALERERSRIARDLHDDLGGRMTKIGFVADRLYTEATEAKQRDALRRLVAYTRYLLEDLHGIIWTVNPQNDSWQRLAAYISRHAQRHLCDTGIICTVDGLNAIPDKPLTPDVRHHVLSVTKEAMNNMLKHSQASRATIEFSIVEERFRMQIRDNGRGFDMARMEDNDGNGLTNMRSRIAEIDGRIEISSKPDQGTEITITVPLQCRLPLHDKP